MPHHLPRLYSQLPIVHRVLTSNIRPGPGGGLGHRRQQRGRHPRHEAAESDPDGAEPGAAVRREPPGAPLHGPGRDPARQQRRRHREAAARESHAQVLYLYTSVLRWLKIFFLKKIYLTGQKIFPKNIYSVSSIAHLGSSSHYLSCQRPKNYIFLEQLLRVLHQH